MDKLKVDSSRPRANSQSSLADFLKRKREEDPNTAKQFTKSELTAFSSSKKVTRSPNKPKPEMEGHMKILLEKMEELMIDIRHVKSSNEEIKAELRKREEEWKKDKMEMQEQIDDLKEKLDRITVKQERKEREERRRNIVVTGYIGEGKQLQTEFESFCQSTLGIHLKTTSAREIAKNKRLEPIQLIQLRSLDDKKILMKEKRKLKDMRKHVFINDDLTKEEREKQKEIRIWAKEQRTKGKQVREGFLKAKIVGEEWKSWDEINEMKKI